MPSREQILLWLQMPRKAWVDTLVIGTLLVSLNFIFGSDDLGWIAANPCPYLLIPLLLGARYGSSPGFYTASVSVALVFMLNQLTEMPMGLNTFFREHAYLVFSFFIYGILSGEVNGFFRRKSDRFSFLYDESRERLRKLDGDIKKIAQINNKLQREVLNADNQTFSLDLEVRALYECPTDDLWMKTLMILNRMERILNAAIYGLPEDGKLKRLALLGSEKSLVPLLELEDHPLLQKALSEEQLTAIPEVMEEKSLKREPFLFTMPLKDADNKIFALVVVTEMPFMSFNPRNLRRIDLIASWAAEIIDLRIHAHEHHYRVLSGPENKRIFMPNYLRTKLKLSLLTHQQHDIPSALIVVHPQGGAPMEQSALEQTIIKRVRTGDFAAQVDSKIPHICVLLPFTAERGGTIFIESTQGMIQARNPDFPPLNYTLIQIKDFDSLDALWKHIHKTLHS